MRGQLLDALRAEPIRLRQTSRFFNRRLLMRLSAAAIVALAIGITVFFVTPGSQGTTWAEVVRAIGPIESVQYTTSHVSNSRRATSGAGEELRTTTRNYVTPDAVRIDTWFDHDAAHGPDKAPAVPSTRRITRRDGHEVAMYEVVMNAGQPRSIHQVVAYTCASCPALPQPMAVASDLMQSADVLSMWRRLQDLPPEAVLKRGSQEADGKRLLRFEVIGSMSMPGLEGFQTGTFVLVDPQTKQPVKLETGSIGWSDIRFNEPIAPERFAPPAVPEDLDAEVDWHFTLLADAWQKPGFVFRVLDPQGKPIITKDDVDVSELQFGFNGPGQFGFGGAEPVEMAPRQVTPAGARSAQGFLTREGVDKLDRFMARNPGAEMTIEITGEPPIKRKVYGRLSRQPRNNFPSGAIYFLLPSLADAKAATQPAPAGAGPEGMMEDGAAAPGMAGGMRPGARPAPRGAGRAPARR
jgi:hypothetical protein